MERYRYDAYGGATVLDADGSDDSDGVSDVENPYAFTARRLDLESDLMYYRNRQYSVALGRFISRDPEGYVDWFNLYCYVRARVTKRADPMGLGPPDWVNKLNECVAWFENGNCLELVECMKDVGIAAEAQCIRDTILDLKFLGMVGLQDVLLIMGGALLGGFPGATIGGLLAAGLTYLEIMYVIEPCFCIAESFLETGRVMQRECWAQFPNRRM